MLKILGDIDFTDGYFDSGIGIGTHLMNHEDPFKNLIFSKNDFWVGNFECVCSNIKSTGQPFIINKEHLCHFKHLNAYGVANNHVMQYGESAYNDMIEFFEDNNIIYFGSKKNKSVTICHNGKNIGLIAFSQRPDNFSKKPCYFYLPEYSSIESEIKKLSNCDFIIVFVHWGYEFINYPNIDQKQLGHWIIDSGADIVVGMHPHVAQGFEIYKGKYIFYSLGNAVFNMAWEPTKYGLLLTINEEDNFKIEIKHLKIDSMGFPEIISKVPYRYSTPYLNSLLDINQENELYFFKCRSEYFKYRRSNRLDIIKKLCHPKNSRRFEIINNFIKRRIK